MWIKNKKDHKSDYNSISSGYTHSTEQFYIDNWVKSNNSPNIKCIIY